MLDLFCGAGGLSQGFRSAGFEIIGGADYDPDASASFAANFPAADSIHGDIRKKPIRERIDQLADDSDVIIGGPPCQAFSQVRNHSRIIQDPRNSLYREFVDVVKHAAPMAFVMENVPGLDQMGVKEQVLDDLSVEGEYVVRAQLLDAVDFGVPQTRKRLLFLGVRRDLRIAPPVLVGSGASAAISLRREFRQAGVRYAVTAGDGLFDRSLFERLMDPEDSSLVNAEQALSDLSCLRVGSRDEKLHGSRLPDPVSAYQRLMRTKNGDTLSNVSVPRINDDTRLRLHHLPAGGNFRDLSEALAVRYVTGQKWGPHNGTGQLGRVHYSAYRKLHPHFWSWTLNTKADSVYHYRGQRALSVREFARLQSFPDAFAFTTDARRGELAGRMDGGPAHSRYRQVGNAVPPLLARAVATEFTKLLRRTHPRSKTA